MCAGGSVSSWSGRAAATCIRCSGRSPNSEAHEDRSYGVLVLRLAARSYSWRFVPVAGGSFRDAGTGTCR